MLAPTFETVSPTLLHHETANLFFAEPNRAGNDPNVPEMSPRRDRDGDRNVLTIDAERG